MSRSINDTERSSYKFIKTVTYDEGTKGIKSGLWLDLDKYYESDNDHCLYREIEDWIANYYYENDIVYDGNAHQYGPCQDKITKEIIGGCPIIQNIETGDTYIYQNSMRGWGQLMYDIWHKEFGDPDGLDEMGYSLFAWDSPTDKPHKECQSCTYYYFNNQLTLSEYIDKIHTDPEFGQWVRKNNKLELIESEGRYIIPSVHSFIIMHMLDLMGYDAEKYGCKGINVGKPWQPTEWQCTRYTAQ